MAPPKGSKRSSWCGKGKRRMYATVEKKRYKGPCISKRARGAGRCAKRPLATWHPAKKRCSRKKGTTLAAYRSAVLSWLKPAPKRRSSRLASKKK